MAKVIVRGVSPTYKTLADGTRKTDWYHRGTGARLPGEKGSLEFLAAFVEAERLAPRDVANVAALIRDYFLSNRFQKNAKGRAKADSTKKEYRRIGTVLETEFGKMPIKAVESPRVRGVFIDYQEGIAIDRPREADNRLTVLSLILSHAVNKGKISRNPLERFDRMYSADRSDLIWEQADITRFMDGAPPELQRVIILAIHTGQRYGDLITPRWSDYDGKTIRLRQNKTDARVIIPCTAALQRMFASTPRHGPFILTRADGRPWHTPNDDKALAKAWHRRMDAAGFYPGGWDMMTKAEKRLCLRFNDLRGTAVTLLSEAGATVPQICAITGHTLQSATRILAKYLAMTEALSSAAIRLFENAPATAFANEMQTDNSGGAGAVRKEQGNQ